MRGRLKLSLGPCHPHGTPELRTAFPRPSRRVEVGEQPCVIVCSATACDTNIPYCSASSGLGYSAFNTASHSCTRKVSKRWPQCPCPRLQCQRPGWSLRLVATAWSSPGCCDHLESEPGNGWKTFPTLLYLSLPFSNAHLSNKQINL